MVPPAGVAQLRDASPFRRFERGEAAKEAPTRDADTVVTIHTEALNEKKKKEEEEEEEEEEEVSELPGAAVLVIRCRTTDSVWTEMARPTVDGWTSGLRRGRDRETGEWRVQSRRLRVEMME
uniref:Uncharacterized protein n=1 Tax=Nelumbo nucifera TaxID=4432 RepID=A0A822YZL0_NELNU|nr:TPA_asm: hypothetical protein HUJ06_007532 [Nelumbo nucifera]